MYKARLYFLAFFLSTLPGPEDALAALAGLGDAAATRPLVGLLFRPIRSRIAAGESFGGSGTILTTALTEATALWCLGVAETASSRRAVLISFLDR